MRQRRGQPRPSILLCAALCLLVAGCAAGSAGPTGAVQARDDTFKPFKEYASTPVIVRTLSDTMQLQVIGRKDRASGKTAVLLAVDFGYHGHHKRLYESARNARAEALPVTVVGRHAVHCRHNYGCTYRESLSIVLPEADLRVAAASGYPVKIFAREGPETVVTVSKATIDKILHAMTDPPAAPVASAAAARS